MSRTKAFRTVHRYVSLVFAALWFAQALTGLLLVFHWEIDDATLGLGAVPLDVAAVGRKVEALGGSTLYATGGVDNRFDVHAGPDSVRIDGAGNELRRTPASGSGILDAAITLHHNLFLGDFGRLFIGLSGILLLTNIVLGLVLAWPRRGQWRRTLRPQKLRSGTVGFFYGWHRAVGLWLAVPALLLVLAGIGTAFEEPLEGLLQASRPSPPLTPAAATAAAPPGAAAALQMALDRWPGTRLSSLVMPTAKRPWYRVRVRQPDELRRVYGSTTLFVDARDGSVLGEQDPFRQPPGTLLFEALVPIHTGEAFGLAGRIVVQLLAVWLLAMLVLGVTLWWKRRATKAPARA